MSKSEIFQDILSKLTHFVDYYDIDSLFLAGACCRNIHLNQEFQDDTVDVVSAYNDQSIQMADLFASEVLNTTPIYDKTQNAAVDHQGVKITFQGDSTQQYMKNQEIKDWMTNNKIEDEPIMHNIYGRDFTINALIYSLKNKKIYDLTQKAIGDFDNRKISSILPSPMLVKYNPIAALNAIGLSVKHDFSIDGGMRDAIANSYSYIVSSLSEKRISQEIVGMLKADAEKTINLLKKFKLDKLLLLPLIRQGVRNAE